MMILCHSIRAEEVVRKSRFLAEADPVASAEAARNLWRERKRLHDDCSHVVFAFVCGPQGGVMGCSDDGEPSGTAGRPVLDVLKGSGITNVLLTVTRWFGGIKLGTGGLVRAYAGIARLALADPPVAELVPLTRFTLALSYLQYENVRRRFPDFAAEITGEEFAAAVTLSGVIPSANFAAFSGKVRDLTGGSAVPRQQEPVHEDRMEEH
ncbi:MAG: YigZ family protein [Lentisphaeria bacterium]|nr:YigZ family protein [Lentisphaeria bacterium]